MGGSLQGCKLREAFEKDGGQASLGLWQCLPGANVSRTLARAEGVDWVLIDCEHGNIDGEFAVLLLVLGVLLSSVKAGVVEKVS